MDGVFNVSVRRRLRRFSARTLVFPVAQLGARSVMLRIPLSQCYALGRIFPEYADGTLRKLTANLSRCPLVSSVPLSLHTRLPCKAPYMHGKRKSVILGERNAQHHAPSVRGGRICKTCVLALKTLLAVLRRSRPLATFHSQLARRANSSFINHNWCRQSFVQPPLKTHVHCPCAQRATNNQQPTTNDQ